VRRTDLRYRLDALVRRTVDGETVHGIAASIATDDGAFEWTWGAGDLHADSSFFIASTTKLFTTALVLRAVDEGRLRLDDPITRHLPQIVTQGLHTLRGVDHVPAVTIRHLLAHTSGLPDYFQQRRATGRSLQQELMTGKDVGWDLDHVLQNVRAMKPAFAPATPGKAFYSDTNYQLLGAILCAVTGLRYADGVATGLLTRLGLEHTYVYEDPTDTKPKHLYYGRTPLHIPMAMASFGPDGGIVSTASDLMRFLRAFFGGRLFAPAHLPLILGPWNRIFFPMQYGVGVMRFKLPRIMSPFTRAPEFLGHSGLSGAFAFHCPAKRLFLCGTVNQITPPSLSFRLMMKLASEVVP
jgi:D-alanyl-D-alanine carboxypeptidase